ncbi:MAG: prepilin-type N-terminal cleavage/methylation domain-containing protein [Verrucomicrobia bacterium]|nr:prepilin-type N-terminal cleavage/methylation domain-containing protein [Verrucomicrobiota bacterium]
MSDRMLLPKMLRKWNGFATGRLRASFTLIELLVVIAIISILAALLFPGLKSAKESAAGIRCMNGLHQVSVAFQLYANDNDGWSPAIFDSVTSLSWSETLASNSKYLPSLADGRETVMLCPSQKPRFYIAPSGGHFYGMRVPPGAGITGSRFRITSSPIMSAASAGNKDYGAADQTILLGDSVYGDAGSPSDYRYQFYFFIPDGAGFYMVHLRHQKRGNFAFADGHVQSLSRTDLVGKHGASDGTGTFIPGAIDELPAQP